MKRAFTLIELLVTVACIALLVGLVAGPLARSRDAARNTACLSNLRQLGLLTHQYVNDFGRLPGGPPEGLGDIPRCPSNRTDALSYIWLLPASADGLSPRFINLLDIACPPAIIAGDRQPWHGWHNVVLWNTQVSREDVE